MIVSVMNPQEKEGKQEKQKEYADDCHRHWRAGSNWPQTPRHSRLAEWINNRTLLTLILSATACARAASIAREMHRDPASRARLPFACKNDVLTTNRARAAGDLHTA